MPLWYSDRHQDNELIALDCVASNEHIRNARTGVRQVQTVEIAFELEPQHTALCREAVGRKHGALPPLEPFSSCASTSNNSFTTKLS